MKLALILWVLILSACTFGNQKRVITEFLSAHIEFPESSTKIEIEKCRSEMQDVNPNCQNFEGLHGCPEPKELEACEYMLHVSSDGCYHQVRVSEKCDEIGCKYVFGFYGISVCN